MLLEISSKSFFNHFPNEPHSFLKKEFIDLNSHKVESVLYLIQDTTKPDIGLVLGEKDGSFLSHFSAPFGGFHYRNENIYISEMEDFIDNLKRYVIQSGSSRISFTFPTSIYGHSFNSKMINTLIRKEFNVGIPGLTNWVDLREFENRFKQRNSREFYMQALRNKLSFQKLEKEGDKKSAFQLIADNRKRNGRPLYMVMEDLLRISTLWPVDYFGVYDSKNDIIASAIFYQFPKNIIYAVFWGDNELGRPLRAMDFLSFNLWCNYKKLGFIYIDLGISSELEGKPNEGLLRFKETHEAQTEIRYKISWEAPESYIQNLKNVCH